MHKASSDHILQLINPPDRIRSWEHLGEVINDSARLTLIERSFFDEVKNIATRIIEQQVEGDVVIAGVFKGGAALYLKALFEEAGMFKKWWLFDSFIGFNTGTLKHEQDLRALEIISNEAIVETQPDAATVYQLFKAHNLDNNLEIVEGYFEDTFPVTGINQISLLHIDVDFYEPTYLCLEKFYPLLQEKGWVIADDYYLDVFECRNAVDTYRKQAGITQPLLRTGNYPAAWQKCGINVEHSNL